MNHSISPFALPPLPHEAIHVRRVWMAMATRFEVELFGPDPEHLEAVGAAIEDEVRRLDALLSRHNPTSEISRLNRRAAGEPLRVDADVWQVLEAADKYRQATEGFFDVTAASAAQAVAPRLQLDAPRQTVRFSSPGVTIDLGGIGKGFALDRAKQLIASYGVASALVSAGTSSILAVGRPPIENSWPVRVRHPADDTAEPVDDTAEPVGRVELVDRSLSCSASVRPGQAISDLVDPHTGLPLTGGEAVLVLADSGVQAEALSTALLAMGRRRAAEYLAHSGSTMVDVARRPAGTVPFSQQVFNPRLDVAWIGSSQQTPNLEWLVRSHD